MNNCNLSTKVYKNIKAMLIEIVLSPGSQLCEQDLANRLGVSRTPVREALQRLSHEGWVQIGDKKRILVCPVSVEDIEELFQLRSIFEPCAAREAVAKGRARILAAQLDDVVEKMCAKLNDRTAFAQLDMQFHSYLMSNIGSSRLDRFLQTLHEEISRLASMNLTDKNRPATVIQEHFKMVDAFWKKDIDQIIGAISEHLQKSKDALMIKINRNALNPKISQKILKTTTSIEMFKSESDSKPNVEETFES